MFRSVIVASCVLPTRHGQFQLDLHSVKDQTIPVLRNLDPVGPGRRRDVHVRVHDACFTSDVLTSARCDCGEQLEESIRMLGERSGLLIYMPNEGRGIGLVNKAKAYDAQDSLGLNTYEANAHLGLPEDGRDYTRVPAILETYGVDSVRLMSNSAVKSERLRAEGVAISELVPVFVAPRASNEGYMLAKAANNVHLRPSPFRPVSVAVEALRRGEPVIVLDDEGRENEGDLVMAAEFATPERMGFFIRHTSGIVCCPMTPERARQLWLPPMARENQDAHETAFTVSVDAVGTGTGISARDRCKTALALAGPRTRPDELRRPGHVFPLVAKPGGVWEREGHTEASVELCRLAGAAPVAVISEITTEDGMGVATRDELEWFAHRHGLAVVTIPQLKAFLERKGMRPPN